VTVLYCVSYQNLKLRYVSVVVVVVVVVAVVALLLPIPIYMRRLNRLVANDQFDSDLSNSR